MVWCEVWAGLLGILTLVASVAVLLGGIVGFVALVVYLVGFLPKVWQNRAGGAFLGAYILFIVGILLVGGWHMGMDLYMEYFCG